MLHNVLKTDLVYWSVYALEKALDKLSRHRSLNWIFLFSTFLLYFQRKQYFHDGATCIFVSFPFSGICPVSLDNCFGCSTLSIFVLRGMLHCRVVVFHSLFDKKNFTLYKPFSLINSSLLCIKTVTNVYPFDLPVWCFNHGIVSCFNGGVFK